MKVDWTPLRRGLKHYSMTGLPLSFWWRDDDAVAKTAALERLTDLSTDLRIPVHIAVVPDLIEHSLVEHVSHHATLLPLVHGWRHTNHAHPEEKKAEFNALRPNGAKELHGALTRMQDQFASRVLPVFVPPWNRIDAAYIQVLADAGYRALSTYGARPAVLAAPDVAQINTHIDPIDWHGTRDLKDPEVLIAQIVGTLEMRAKGDADANEPLGFLTHHLVHTPQLWDFSRNLLSELRDGGADAISLKTMLEHPDEPT